MNDSDHLDNELNDKSIAKTRSVHFDKNDIILEPPASLELSQINEKKSPRIRRRSFAEKSWITHTSKEKMLFITKTLMKLLVFISLVYLFLVALNFMNIGFTMVAAYTYKAKDIIKYLLHNPFGSLCIGIIVTAFLQNAT